MTLEHWDAYTDAAIKMYTEEIGVSPVSGNSAGYRFYVRQLISSGRAFATVRRQPGAVQGRPRLGLRARSARCRASGSTPSCAAAGMAPAAMAAVVKLARTVVPTVSLYVNDYNHAARATYDRVGFDAGRRVRDDPLLARPRPAACARQEPRVAPLLRRRSDDQPSFLGGSR